MIEQRRPRLEARRHAGAIDLGEDVVGEVGHRVEQHHALDEARRDGMNAPIVYDRARRVYQLEPHDGIGTRYMLPGLWLTPAQAYAEALRRGFTAYEQRNVIVLLRRQGAMVDPVCRVD